MGGSAASGPARLRSRLERRADALFAGVAPGYIYDVLRIGIAATFLVRHSDWLRPLLHLEHHRFVRGLLFLGSTATEPRLSSPLALGWPLSPTLNDALVYLRTALAVLLLFGVRTRLTAGTLALVSYLLLAADRYRYYHHLFLLYVVVAALALTPNLTRLSLERMVRKARAPLEQPLWPLQVLRALPLSVYLAAALSKVDAQWLRGDAVEALHRLNVLGGPAFELMLDSVGYSGVGALSCAVEFLLPALLLLRGTRRLGVVVAWAFHAGISLSMPVYSFGVQMAFLVFAFWPDTRTATLDSRG